MRKHAQSVIIVASILALAWLATFGAPAQTVTWDVDPAASSLQLTMPDQTVFVTNNGIGNINVKMRDPADNNLWTAAGGRLAHIDGTFTTLYSDLVSITFQTGSTNLYALEQVNLRPNPADWDPGTLSFTNTRTAPTAFGARVRGTYASIFTFDIAYFTMRNVRLDLASSPIPITAGALAVGQTQFGIASATSDVDGLDLPLGLGQPVPDLLRTEMAPILATNSLGGTVQNIGGSNRKLTLNIAVPIAIDLQGTVLTGSAAGLIVAYATLEPPTLRITPSINQNVVLAWSTNVIGFVLEHTAALTAPNWTLVTNSITTVGSEKRVTLPASGTSEFYRLRRQ